MTGSEVVTSSTKRGASQVTTSAFSGDNPPLEVVTSKKTEVAKSAQHKAKGRWAVVTTYPPRLSPRLSPAHQAEEELLPLGWLVVALVVALVVGGRWLVVGDLRWLVGGGQQVSRAAGQQPKVVQPKVCTMGRWTDSTADVPPQKESLTSCHWQSFGVVQGWKVGRLGILLSFWWFSS